MRNLSSRSGLTLVELVITISVAAILSIPLGILLSEHLSAAIRARDSAVAMSLARYDMERVDSLYSFCDAALNLTVASGTLVSSPNPAYEVRRAVLCQTPTSNCACSCSGTCGTGNPTNARNDIKRIEVRVTRTGATEQLASLVTYRTKYVSFGP